MTDTTNETVPPDLPATHWVFLRLAPPHPEIAPWLSREWPVPRWSLGDLASDPLDLGLLVRHADDFLRMSNSDLPDLSAALGKLATRVALQRFDSLAWDEVEYFAQVGIAHGPTDEVVWLLDAFTRLDNDPAGAIESIAAGVAHHRSLGAPLPGTLWKAAATVARHFGEDALAADLEAEVADQRAAPPSHQPFCTTCGTGPLVPTNRFCTGCGTER